jgi:hypothetical protein
VPSAESGSGKSETFRLAAQPVAELECALLERWKTETFPELDAEREMLEIEIAGLKKKAGLKDANRAELKKNSPGKKKSWPRSLNRSTPPSLRRNVTSEELAVLLAQNNEQLASLSPDAGAIINNLLGRYSHIKRTDENIYLKAYSGDFCKVNRRSRPPVFLKSPCLAALWLIQPDKLNTLLSVETFTEGGLIPRLLACHTRAEPQLISDAGTPAIPAAVQESYEKTIRSLADTYRAGEDGGADYNSHSDGHGRAE